MSRHVNVVHAVEVGARVSVVLAQYLVHTPRLAAGPTRPRPRLQAGDVVQGRAEGPPHCPQVFIQLEEERKVPMDSISLYSQHKTEL